jgi:ATP-dependent helicase/nuclease subunit A
MMSEMNTSAPPPDQVSREYALDASKSVLVRAPAGSGKTDLLTRRFLRLLSQVDDPSQIVAITFTKAAAAEMRNRILAELEKAASSTDVEKCQKQDNADELDAFSMEALAERALAHSQSLGWKLLDVPAQLRISTIDSFCRELALQEPLLSGLGGGLEVSEQPKDLYRRAARRTLENIEKDGAALREAIEGLLLWRDNGWKDVEDQLVEMLEQRDRWMREFVLERDPDWNAVRRKLERPFAREVRTALEKLSRLIESVPGAREDAKALATFGCEQTGGRLYRELAELAEFPAAPFETAEQLEEACRSYRCLAALFLTDEGEFRKRFDIHVGFPKENKNEKDRLLALIASLDAVPGLETELAAVLKLPPVKYSDDEWRIVQACFLMLRHAAAELRVVFAEAATVDFTEVAQIAIKVLTTEDGAPSEAAMAVADGIHHVLVDEFQDTSRRQHELLGRLVAAWPERDGRTCFLVGDPMQAIYFFRDADAELFPRAENAGLEIPGDEPLLFDAVHLTANFRTAPTLVERVNHAFSRVFAIDDGSGVKFTRAEPARKASHRASLHLVSNQDASIHLHVDFEPQMAHGNSATDRKAQIKAEQEAAHEKQTREIVALIESHQSRIAEAREAKGKYRVAVLGRTRKALAPIAAALRNSGIPFRAVELEELRERPEIIDALALIRALLNLQDRVAWLGVLRAPWCGLSLADLHALVSADNKELVARAVSELLVERMTLLSREGQVAVQRVMDALHFALQTRMTETIASPGTWMEQVWLRLGGARCVDAAARANLDLLWNSLDSLADGEADLLGPALQSALDKLTAQPDPKADSDCGVQLMTIHKSKGLEFEVVIVPELQAPEGRTKTSLLSWLEVGIADPDKSEEPTEFLVAPLQSKGAERGSAKRWVDELRRTRERQEMRRLLYVAATRPREELHLFARPAYKIAGDGVEQLVTPWNSLLATAWPAFEKEIRERFDMWRAGPSQGVDIAASEARTSGPSDRPTILRRLPPEFDDRRKTWEAPTAEELLVGTGHLYERHEGGLLSRTLGTAVHALLQRLAQHLAAQPENDAMAAIAPFMPSITAQIRAVGADAQEARSLASQALEIAQQALADPIGRWILSPQESGASEVRWTGVINGSLRTVQVDRVFRAGPAPRIDASASGSSWWIIDYKTAHGERLDRAALSDLRRIFAPQVEAYGKVLRNLRGDSMPIYAGLYYPRMPLLDWWEL